MFVSLLCLFFIETFSKKGNIVSIWLYVSLLLLVVYLQAWVK